MPFCFQRKDYRTFLFCQRGEIEEGSAVDDEGLRMIYIGRANWWSEEVTGNVTCCESILPCGPINKEHCAVGLPGKP